MKTLTAKKLKSLSNKQKCKFMILIIQNKCKFVEGV